MSYSPNMLYTIRISSRFKVVAERTLPAVMVSHSKGLLKRKAVRMPESGSGQSFICSASICAAITAVGGSMGVGPLCSRGLLVPI